MSCAEHFFTNKLASIYIAAFRIERNVRKAPATGGKGEMKIEYKDSRPDIAALVEGLESRKDCFAYITACQKHCGMANIARNECVMKEDGSEIIDPKTSICHCLRKPAA